MDTPSSTEPLVLTPEEACAVFAAQGDFISRLNAHVDSVRFNSLPIVMQEFILANKGRHEAAYKKTADYLTRIGCGQETQEIYNKDTKTNIKPKGGI